MLTKLPKWVEYGAFTLAVLAGIINAIGLLGFQHQAVSHLSGTATLLGTELLNSLPASLHLAAIMLSFMLGAALSGFFISSPSLKLGRHYDTLLIMEGLLLIAAIYLMAQQSSYGQLLTSAACGLQNALATRYSGAVVRTTHVTGIFTDLGIMIGAALRGEPFNRRQCSLFLVIITGFVFGGVVGCELFSRYEFKALALPASVCFVLALAYRIYSINSNKREIT